MTVVALNNPVSPTVEAIHAVYKDAQDGGERHYLGASVIGDECERRLWLMFRWAYEAEDFLGQMLRLFATGHREEARMIDDLRRAGIEVWDSDPDDPSKQIGISAVGGHFRGHMDGVCIGIREAPRAAHVLECKTHNAKSFGKLLAHGVRASKPKHYAQMQTYMHEMGIKRAAYMAHCKNTDKLYIERVHYDPTYALWLLAKAEAIITADKSPPKLHDDPTHKMAWECRHCHLLEPCQRQGARVWARRNCRTCLHSTAMLDGDGRWFCERHKRDLTLIDQRAGCANHLYIPDLVNGDPIDADEAMQTVTYQLDDGEIFIDGATQ